MNEQLLTETLYALRQLRGIDQSRLERTSDRTAADRVQRAIDALERCEERLTAVREDEPGDAIVPQRCNLCGEPMIDESGDVHLSCAYEENVRGDF